MRALALTPLIGLAVGVASLMVSALSHAPAFNPTLRLPEELGDWRVPGDTEAHYDPVHYANAINTRLLDQLGRENDGPLLFEIYQRALGAIDSAPSDAIAWNALAWSAASLGYETPARGALGNSRLLAPYSGGLALRRMMLTRLWADDLTEVEMAGARRDLLALHHSLRWLEFTEVLALDPIFQQMADAEDLRPRRR